MKLLKTAMVGILGTVIAHTAFAYDDVPTPNPNFKEAYVGLLTPSKNFNVVAGGLYT